MSTRPGNHVKKKPGQKHKNTFAFKFDKHKTDPQAKMLKSLQVNNCCDKCTAVIEWKIKYGKYKPLTAPARCVDCGEKCVKHNYHVRCAGCVAKSGKCAKCGERVGEFVHTAGPSQAELAREEADFQRELRCLPERRKRAFLRWFEENPDPEEAKQRLAGLKDKFGKEGTDFDLDDLDDDLDDLDLQSDSGGED